MDKFIHFVSPSVAKVFSQMTALSSAS